MRNNRISSEAYPLRLPTPPVPSPSPNAFLLCPLPSLHHWTAAQALCVQWVYQQALEQAQAVLRPSLPERDLLGVWN